MAKVRRKNMASGQGQAGHERGGVYETLGKRSEKIILEAPMLVEMEATQIIKLKYLTLAPSTQKRYVYTIRRWLQIIDKPLLKADSSDVYKFIERMMNLEGHRSRVDGSREMSRHSIYVVLCRLSCLYRSFFEQGLIPKNPFHAELVASFKKGNKTKRIYWAIDFKLVIPLIDSPGKKTARGLRDRALLAVLFGGGLRQGEACNLRLCDLGTTKAGAIVMILRRPKSQKEQRQVLPKWASQRLLDWLKVRRRQTNEKSAPVFFGYMNKKMCQYNIIKIFRRACERVGLDPAQYSPHCARATAITKLLSDGMPHNKVQEFSRHASVQMVEAYDRRHLSEDKHPGNELSFG